MRYEGLLVYETGMHMVMMGPNLGKQLMDLYHTSVAMNETDKMLSRGFEDQIYDVFKHLAMINSKILRPNYIK